MQRSIITYTIRESSRSKRINLRISPQGTLEVVVPVGFDRTKIPEIVESHQAWIEKHRDRIKAQPQKQFPEALPTSLEFLANTEAWTIEYSPANVQNIRIKQLPKTVTLCGNVENKALCRNALRLWLKRRAGVFLEPWLRALSEDCNLPFNKFSVRGQRTLWGSCSSDKNISLNYKLLFLPPQVVRYVLIHELCHTIHMNHSKDFWQLVKKNDPLYKQWDRDLKNVSQYIPQWLEE